MGNEPGNDSSPWAGASVLWGLAAVVASAVVGAYLVERGFRETGEFVGYLCWAWGFLVWLAASLFSLKRMRGTLRPLRPSGLVSGKSASTWFGFDEGQFPGPPNRITALRAATTRSTVSAIITAIILLALLSVFVIATHRWLGW